MRKLLTILTITFTTLSSNIPANVKHWHGAAKDSCFSHLAFEIPGEETANEWLEPVSDEDYLNLK